MASKKPPNLVICSDCSHEWHARTWSHCPKCKSTRLSVRCGSKRNGGCRARVSKARGGRGRHCGGKSLAGPASPRWRSGAYSVIPARYAKAFAAAVGDPHLLSVARDLALLEARKAELLEQLGGATGPAADQVWQALYGVIDERRRTVSTELRRLEIEKDMIPREVMAAAIYAVILAAREFIPDPSKYTEFSQKLRGLVEEPAAEGQ